VGGGLAISAAPVSPGVKVVAGTLFVAVAVSTVVLPVVLVYVLGARVQPWLESTNSWLEANNITVMAVLLVVIGVALIGKGISGF
jgi:Sap, sulfolipid-1-addressing protein